MAVKHFFMHNRGMLDVKRLQVLLAIVEEGSVTSAATALGYTPSAVSQQLLRLEREAGQPLLDRHARGMTPTDAGLVLARHARKVVRQLAAAEADLADIAGVRRGSVTLGTFPTVGSSFLPSLYADSASSTPPSSSPSAADVRTIWSGCSRRARSPSPCSGTTSGSGSTTRSSS